MKTLIEGFFRYIQEKRIDIYNEVSFQLELGIFLREQLPDYKVEFERNIKTFFPNASDTVKHEIDIVVWKETNGRKEYKYAVELKFPRNGQYPEEMYQFVRDVKFMEEVKALGFQQTYAITIANDCSYFESNAKTKATGIYAYFRNRQPLCGIVYKPTGKEKGVASYSLKGAYTVVWEAVKDAAGSEVIIDGNALKYYLLETCTTEPMLKHLVGHTAQVKELERIAKMWQDPKKKMPKKILIVSKDDHERKEIADHFIEEVERVTYYPQEDNRKTNDFQGWVKHTTAYALSIALRDNEVSVAVLEDVDRVMELTEKNQYRSPAEALEFEISVLDNSLACVVLTASSEIPLKELIDKGFFDKIIRLS